MFAAIGGVIAVILPAQTEIGAVYAGAAWPALIAAGGKAVGGGGGVVKAIPPPPPDGMNIVEPAQNVPAREPASIGSFFRAL